MRLPCDGDSNDIPGQSWCLIDASRSDAACVSAGENWDYCMPNVVQRSGFGAAIANPGSCSMQGSDTSCANAGCVWNAITTECEDQGTCVERPGLAQYRLRSEEELMVEANGAARASVGVVALLALACAGMDLLR